MTVSKTIEYPYHDFKIPGGVSETVKKLGQKYLLGVVSSRAKGSVEKCIEFLDLQLYFKTIVGMEDTKNHKPHPEPFLVAMHRLDVKPETTIYIGDAETDMQASIAAGIHFIHFGSVPLAGTKYSIQSFKGLPPLIQALSERSI